MAKAKPSAEAQAAVAAAKSAVGSAPAKGFVEPTAPTKTVKNPPITDEAKAAKEAIAAQKAADKVAADATKAEKAKEREDKKAAADKEKSDRATAREQAKKDRAEKLAALVAEGRSESSMLALAEKVKSGVYVKGANGQLRSTNDLAVALDGVAPTNVVRIGLDLLKIEDNPYTKLNVGQQSMNLRNRMRGAIKKEVISLADIAAYIERNKIPVTTAADTEAAAKAKADAKVAEPKPAE